MAYVINGEDFKREFSIPNTDEMNSKTLVELNSFIGEVPRLLLRRALGAVNVADFESYLVDGLFPDDTTGIPQKWINLVNGVTYTVDDVDYVWDGLLPSFGFSILVKATYHNWLTKNITYLSGVGEVQAEAKNAKSANSTQRLVELWNEFVGNYQGSLCHTAISNVYHIGIPQINGYYYGYGNNTDGVSLIQFLSQNTDVYEDCPLWRYEIENQLGL